MLVLTLGGKSAQSMAVAAVALVVTAASGRWKRDVQEVGMLRPCEMCVPTSQMQAVVVAAAEASTVYESALLQR